MKIITIRQKKKIYKSVGMDTAELPIIENSPDISSAFHVEQDITYVYDRK